MYTNPEVVTKAFVYAREQGVSIVVSAGNSGESNDSIIHYPLITGADTNVFVVGSNTAISNNGQRVDFHITDDNFCNARNEGRFLSAVPGGSDDRVGSSYSAAFASGVIALALGIDPALISQQLREIIQRNTVPYQHPNGYATRRLETYLFLREVIWLS